MNNIKVVYFAHPVIHYNTEFEWECIETIVTMLTPIGEDPREGNIQIMNPNQQWLQNLYQNRKADNHEDPFGIFHEISKSCDIIVGCTFFDGVIGAGIAGEMKIGLENGKDVYLIFIQNNKKLFFPVSNMDNYTIWFRFT